MLLGGAWGGVIADRVNRRNLLVATGTGSALLAITLGVLTMTGAVQLWMVCLLAAGLGAMNMLEIPTRQAFVLDMVKREDLTNAISLNSVIMNGGRVVGPALAGVLIATAGIGVCFVVNAISYLAVITGLLAMRSGDLNARVQLPRARGQLIEGLRYVWATPALRTPLLMMAVVGTFAYEFSVTLPLVARFSFDVGARGLGLMNSVMAAGAVAGGLVTASRARPSGRRLAVATLSFGGLVLLTALAPTFWIALLLLAATGGASIFFAAMANTSIQLAASPEMRGRVMALYAVAFMGSTPIGGPLVGWIGQAFDPRAALAVGGYRHPCWRASWPGAHSPAAAPPRAGRSRSTTTSRWGNPPRPGSGER